MASFDDEFTITNTDTSVILNITSGEKYVWEANNTQIITVDGSAERFLIGPETSQLFNLDFTQSIDPAVTGGSTRNDYFDKLIQVVSDSQIGVTVTGGEVNIGNLNELSVIGVTAASGFPISGNVGITTTDVFDVNIINVGPLIGVTTGGIVGITKVIEGTNVVLENMGLGLEIRTRGNHFPEIIRIGSIYYQTNYVSSVERSVGMPENSGQDIYTRLFGATGIQISSSSADDVGVTGIGARTVYCEGFSYDSGEWISRTTFSDPTTLTGQAPVQIGVSNDWYRINKIWVLSTGSSDANVGDLYISPIGQSTTNGVPDDNILQAVISGYNNSTGGFFLSWK